MKMFQFVANQQLDMLKVLVSLLLVVAMQGCGSSSDSVDTTIDDDVYTGSFTINAPGQLNTPAISNLSYQTDAQSGVTNEDGNFSYVTSDYITFSIGELKFPLVEPTSDMTVYILGGVIDATNQKVNNIARLLYSIDADFDSSNGIQISDIAKENATEVDFNVDSTTFETDPNIISLVANSGSINVTLISAFQAQVNLESGSLGGATATIDIGSNKTVAVRDWMSKIDGNLIISQITMPGTHDSATGDHFVVPYVTTQTKNMQAQLDGGVRVLDIRLRYVDPGILRLSHGGIDLGKNFGNVIDIAIAFLHSHPTETVMLMIKQEKSTVDWEKMINTMMDSYIKNSDREKYFKYASDFDNWWPSLDAVRGKIIMTGRFGNNASPSELWYVNWPDNTKGYTVNPGNHVYFVQDNYSPDTTASKQTQIDAGLLWAHTDADARKFFFNFTSASKAVNLKTPGDYAEDINPAIDDEAKSKKHTGKNGTILIDYALDNDYRENFVNHIIEMNTFVQ